MGPGGDVASFLLAHTGELKLSDQQVTRLAAIARRFVRPPAGGDAGDGLAHVRAVPQRRDSAARGRFAPSPELRAAAERLRDQRHADLRDALGVLTPDQQATAWELSARRGGSWMARGPGPAGSAGGWAPGRPGGAFVVGRDHVTAGAVSGRLPTAPVRAPDLHAHRPDATPRQVPRRCHFTTCGVAEFECRCIYSIYEQCCAGRGHRVRDQDRAGRGRADRHPRRRRAARESARGGARGRRSLDLQVRRDRAAHAVRASRSPWEISPDGSAASAPTSPSSSIGWRRRGSSSGAPAARTVAPSVPSSPRSAWSVTPPASAPSEPCSRRSPSGSDPAQRAELVRLMRRRAGLTNFSSHRGISYMNSTATEPHGGCKSQ